VGEVGTLSGWMKQAGTHLQGVGTICDDLREWRSGATLEMYGSLRG